MEQNVESEADALWQDTLDLLTDENLPESMLAMLRSCTPVSLADGTLHVDTSMRVVQSKVSKNAELIEKCLSTAAFEPTRLSVTFTKANGVPVPSTASSSMSREEADRWAAETSGSAQGQRPKPRIAEDGWDERDGKADRDRALQARRNRNPLVEDVPQESSKLTFERFVHGEENDYAYQAALQVANGVNKNYNPLFIYGKSGVGKTHLLRAIQNYIAKNDQSRICVYRDASAFISDYTGAMADPSRSAAAILRQNYEDVDVLIIDDIQMMAGKAGTVSFFFDTFNTLISNGKQIVLAADRTPAELGMGKGGFDERVTSRLGSGFLISIQVPSYELKLRLIDTFCKRMHEDGEAEHVGLKTGVIPDEMLSYMAERAGTNIRIIEGFCQRCLVAQASAEARGESLTRDEVDHIAKETWPENKKSVSIEQVQRAVEKYYDISHADLVGNKRNKGIMEARHVAIWLSRELCDRTLADIGKHFGGRSHATVMHSISVVDEARRDDKTFYDRVVHIQESVGEGH